MNTQLRLVNFQPITRYKGWAVYDNGHDYHPKTGRFMAYRHGVRIGHSTRDGLVSMIDNRPELVSGKP